MTRLIRYAIAKLAYWAAHLLAPRLRRGLVRNELVRRSLGELYIRLIGVAPTPPRAGRPAPRKVEPSHFPFGVSVAGFLQSEKGMGESVRSSFRALAAARVPLALVDFVDPLSDNIEQVAGPFSQGNPYRVNLIHVNPHSLAGFLLDKGSTYFEDRYNIGYWNWELSTFPEAWADRFQPFDEIWVPSAFTLDAISRVSPVPVVRIPPCLRAEPERVAAPARARFGIGAEAFVFLFAFDFQSSFERKNPLAVIESFRAAFRGESDLVLVIKSVHSDFSRSGAQRLREASRGLDVRLIDQVLSRDELDDLFRLCDCYVSLHRAEGFGLTMAEAMELGKPVIATAYSGNMDFMAPGNSFPVKYQLIDVAQTAGGSAAGVYSQGVWAEPDVSHAAELMRYVYEHRDEAGRFGRQGREDVLRALHPEVVGVLARERLLRVAADRRGRS